MVVFDGVAGAQDLRLLQARHASGRARAGRPPAARWRSRSDRSCGRQALPARGKSGGCRGRRSARSCPRSRGSSAARGSRSGRNTSPSDAGSRRMMSCVAAVVRVMWQSTCGVVIAAVIVENGSGGSSPGCRSRLAQSIVRPSRRGGVPVFSRPSRRPGARQRLRQADARRLAMPAGRRRRLAEMDQPAQERAGRQHDRRGCDLAAVRQPHAGDAAVCDDAGRRLRLRRRARPGRRRSPPAWRAR